MAIPSSWSWLHWPRSDGRRLFLLMSRTILARRMRYLSAPLHIGPYERTKLTSWKAVPSAYRETLSRISGKSHFALTTRIPSDDDLIWISGSLSGELSLATCFCSASSCFVDPLFLGGLGEEQLMNCCIVTDLSPWIIKSCQSAALHRSLFLHSIVIYYT